MIDLFFEWWAWAIVLVLTLLTLISSVAKYRLGKSGLPTLKEHFPRVSDDRWERLDLYFVETGQVTARVEDPGREPVRLETMQGGRVVGEIGFYLGNPRTAAVVTDEPSTIYRLSRSALQQMEKTDPEVASTFHQIIVHLVTERLTHLINTVQALER